MRAEPPRLINDPAVPSDPGDVSTGTVPMAVGSKLAAVQFPRLPSLHRPPGLALFGWLERELGDAERAAIAAADYGEMATENRAAIDGILAAGRVPAPLEWVPKEVLELTRWLEPRADHTAQSLAVMHRQRLFATAALLQSLGDDLLGQEATPETLGAFVESAITLGPAVRSLALVFLVDVLLAIKSYLEGEVAGGAEGSWEEVFVGHLTFQDPLLVLGLAMLSSGPEEPTLLTDDLSEVAAVCRQWSTKLSSSGSNPAGDPDPALWQGNQRKGLWRDLLAETLIDDPLTPADLRAWATAAVAELR